MYHLSYSSLIGVKWIQTGFNIAFQIKKFLICNLGLDGRLTELYPMQTQDGDFGIVELLMILNGFNV